MTFTKIAALAAGGALLVSASASLAQTQPARPPAADQRAPVTKAAKAGRERPDPAARAARHAERLRTTLQLRPDQEPALKTYVAALAQTADAPRRDGEPKLAATTPQRLDAQRDRASRRMAALDRRIAATKAFYAQLSPAQQKAFDTLSARDGRHDGMRREGRH